MLSYRLFSKSILAIAISQTVLSGVAIAEDTTVLIDEIKIEGRAITELDQAVSDTEISQSQATTLSELFKNKSEVSAGGPVKMGQKIYVRNIGEDSLNITVDGAEQAGAIFHHAGRLSVEPELLKRVEIEAGAANATAGPGALGGSVRFITKDASDLLKDNQNIGALLKSTYSTNGNSLKNSATIYGRTSSGNTQAMLSIISGQHDNYEDGNSDEIGGSESEEELGFLKVKTHLTDEQTLSISHENLTEEGDVNYKPEWATHSTKNVTEPTAADRETTTLNYDFTNRDNDLIDTSITVYRTKNQQEREYSGTSYSGYFETLGLTLENTSLISSHQLTYGLNYRDDTSYYINSDLSETGNVAGLYIQDTIDLSDKLILSTGLRYDQYELTDVNGQELSDGGLSPNIGTTYHINDTLNVTANYAQALRGAEAKDAFKLDSSSNSSDLTAETSENIELGINYNTNRLEVGFGVYQSTINDVIGLTLPWGKVYTNLEDPIETNGYYLDVTYRLNSLIAGLHFHSADTVSGDDIVTRYVYGSTANSIGDTLALSLDYEFNKKFKVGWSAEMVKGIHDIDLDVGGTELNIDKPGYTTHDIYAQWVPLKDDSLTLTLTVNNLFDKEYLSHASVADYTDHTGYEAIIGSYEAGRDIRLSAAYKF
ncbi:MAG: TonB-dependent receptor domain-containing protein [Marinomonas colpomeniae]